MAASEKIVYKEAGKYRLEDDYAIILDFTIPAGISTKFIELQPLTTRSCVLMIKEGYNWDGASGGFQTKSTMRPSLVHDALYELMGLGLLPLSYRLAADNTYRKLLDDDGATKLRAGWQWLAIRIFGGGYAAKPDRPIEYAP